MKEYPTSRFVFDRKHTATRTKAALIQIEVLYERRKKYISTGVKVFKNQFTQKTLVCNSFEMVPLNKRLRAQKQRIDDFITSLIEKGESFTFEKLDAFLKTSSENTDNFIDWLALHIEQRQDIRENTRRTHRKLVTSLEDFGKIVAFSDLTKKNITDYDAYLHQQNIRQTTIYSYHKLLKIYIHEAIRQELLTVDPYACLQFKRGESRDGRFLSEDEFNAFRTVELPIESLRRVRDLFVLQCYTGLSYADLMAFDFSKVKTDADGTAYLSDHRHKTGVEFCAVLLPEAMAIVEKYGGKLPQITNQQYNMWLKLVAEYAGIHKKVASHWGRRTCGMLLLNKGVSMETVAKVLGHSSIRTTESVYAKLLPETVVSEVKKKAGK